MRARNDTWNWSGLSGRQALPDSPQDAEQGACRPPEQGACASARQGVPSRICQWQAEGNHGSAAGGLGQQHQIPRADGRRLKLGIVLGLTREHSGLCDGEARDAHEQQDPGSQRYPPPPGRDRIQPLSQHGSLALPSFSSPSGLRISAYA